MKCIDCGKPITEIPAYLQNMGVEMRCNVCSAKRKASRKEQVLKPAVAEGSE